MPMEYTSGAEGAVQAEPGEQRRGTGRKCPKVMRRDMLPLEMGSP